MTQEDIKYKNSRLYLHPGGDLIKTHATYDKKKNSIDFLDSDVTDRAVEHLFEVIHLAPGVLMYDVFALVARAPFLKDLFRHYQIEQLLVEAANVPRVPSDADTQKAGCMELFWVWKIDENNAAFSGMEYPQLRAVGPVQREDFIEKDSGLFGAGGKSEHELNLCKFSTLLNLPLRVEKEVWFGESNSGMLEESPEMKALSEATLGQMMEGLFRGLSSYRGSASGLMTAAQNVTDWGL